MSMFVPRISAYQSLQNWRLGQANLNTQQLGAPGSGADFSSAFTDAAQNYYTSSSTLAANQALARVQQKAGTSTSSHSAGNTSTTSSTKPAAGSSSSASTTDTRLAAAQATGKSVLASLGLDGSALAAAAQPSKPSSGTYTAPTNSQTGYAFVASSAASLNSLAAVNILA